jgi:hypothetical protein
MTAMPKRDFYGSRLQRAAQPVQNERRECRAFDIFGNDQQ